MKLLKKVLFIVICLFVISLIGVYGLKFAIDFGLTNAQSEITVIETGLNIREIPPSAWEIHKYISENTGKANDIISAYVYINGTGHNQNRFPKNIENDKGFSFILQGIEKRKVFIETIKSESAKLGIDYKIVLSSLLGEQIRIATKGARGDLKSIIVSNTPTLFVSYNVSLGICGIKTTTARQIESEAIKYGYGNIFKNNPVGQSGLYNRLTESEYRQAIYATYLVKNIIVRRSSIKDISENPGVVGTLYNMGNNQKKQPHDNPQIGGSILTIGGKKYSYGGISMAIYRFLTIYK